LDVRGRRWQDAGEDGTNIIRMIKSRKMRWVGHVTFMREMRNAYNIVCQKT
jgi:hypothetical protein